MILKSHVLNSMQTPDGNGKRVPFQFLALTADRAAWRKKQLMMQQLGIKTADAWPAGTVPPDVGGKILEHNNCVLNSARGKHAIGKTRQPAGTGAFNKNPHSASNRTRNIVFLPGDNIRKIHNSLIFQFNRQEVIY